MTWELWRQDDNGQRFLVERFASQAEAEAKLAQLAGGGHRQIYWIEPAAHSVPPRPDNLFAQIPAELPEEWTEALLQRRDFRLERIVSRQHHSPAGFWYDQPQDEWVLLVSGSAGLELADPRQMLELRPGDHLLIPAGCRHRVAWTDPRHDTVWLALFLPAAGGKHA